MHKYYLPVVWVGHLFVHVGTLMRPQAAGRILALFASVFVCGCTVAPKPFSETHFANQARSNLANVSVHQERIAKPIDINEAIARALKYNLDYQVEARQTSLRNAELNLASYAMLPNLVANSGYASRNNEPASSSLNLTTNTENFAASTSQDKQAKTADLTFSWNILDFGLSYVRATQAADKALIGLEMQRKVTHKLMADVRTAYWRAVSFQKLISGLRKLEARTESALANSRLLSNKRDTPLMTALTYERELVDIKRTLKELERDLVPAKAQLAALMNIPPSEDFAVVVPSFGSRVPELQIGLDDMISVALRDRAEIREVVYQTRINLNESRAALLELLPGLQVYAAPNLDTNSFLLHHDWISLGAKASWNLLRVFQYPAKRDLVRSQDDFLHARALALTMAIMTQVHISRVQYSHARQQLQAADEYRSVQNRLMKQVRAESAAGRVSEQTLLREEMNTLIAEAKYDIAYSAVEGAYANVAQSVGNTAVVDVDRTVSVEALAKQLGSAVRYENLEPSGRRPEVASEPDAQHKPPMLPSVMRPTPKNPVVASGDSASSTVKLLRGLAMPSKDASKPPDSSNLLSLRRSLPGSGSTALASIQGAK
jgi:outer membrane protein TolC